MLQHNTEQGPHRTHLVHAAVVGMHALCCGLPVALAVSGAVMGVFAWATGPVTALHRWLHGYEIVILALSFTLVGVGGFLEWRQHRFKRGVPVLYAVSVCCLCANVAIIAAHRFSAGS